MTIDLALLDRVTQKVVQTPTGTVLCAYDGAMKSVCSDF